MLFHGGILADSHGETKKAGMGRPSIGLTKLSVNAHLVGNNAGRDENQKLATISGVILVFEKPAEERNITEQRHFLNRIFGLGYKYASDDYCAAVINYYIGFDN